MKERDFLNEFLLFIITKDPVVVHRILLDMKERNKCGKAPDIAINLIRQLRKGVVIKQLLGIPKSQLFSTLLDTDNKKVISLLRDLTNELARNKVSCTLKGMAQFGGKSKEKDCYRDKIKTVMREFKDRKLRSGSGSKVTTRSQAIAIALNSAKKACYGK
jgi:hypothetical protein